MSQDFKVVGYMLLTNDEVDLHTQEELEQLSKKKVINPIMLDYNIKVNHQQLLRLKNT
jgi:phosphoribosylformylglycinamidine (FGAM) synthase PurS component